jgi:hypothetical protein
MHWRKVTSMSHVSLYHASTHYTPVYKQDTILLLATCFGSCVRNEGRIYHALNTVSLTDVPFSQYQLNGNIEREKTYLFACSSFSAFFRARSACSSFRLCLLPRTLFTLSLCGFPGLLCLRVVSYCLLSVKSTCSNVPILRTLHWLSPTVLEAERRLLYLQCPYKL